MISVMHVKTVEDWRSAIGPGALPPLAHFFIRVKLTCRLVSKSMHTDGKSPFDTGAA